MKIKLSTVVMLVVYLAAACGQPPEGVPTSADTAVIPNTGSGPTQAPLETSVPTVQSPPKTQAAPPTPTVTPTATFRADPDEMLMINSEGPAPYLVDDQGRSLYVYIEDEQYRESSACVEDCAVEWPPLTVTVPPAAAQGVDPALVGVIVRAGGSLQATYNGWPLYYYLMDTIPGTTNAPNLESLWFLLSPSGEPIGR